MFSLSIFLIKQNVKFLFDAFFVQINNEKLAPGYSIDESSNLMLAINSSHYQNFFSNLKITDINNEIVYFIDKDIKINSSLLDPITGQPIIYDWNLNIFYKYQPWKKPFLKNLLPINIDIKTLKSGVYFLNDNKNIFFIKKNLKSISSKKKLTVLIPTNTINAYSRSNGVNSYKLNKNKRYESNFTFFREFDYLRHNKWIPFLSFIKNDNFFDNFDVNFIADVDMENYRNIQNTNILWIIGHSEYWSKESLNNLVSFNNNGGKILITSGNNFWWTIDYKGYKNQLMYIDKETIIKEDNKKRRLSQTENILTYAGSSFNYGGYSSRKQTPSDAILPHYVICNEKHEVFKNTNLKFNSHIYLKGRNEVDGPPLKIPFNNEGCPLPDMKKIDFDTIEILAYIKAYRSERENYGTIHVFKKNIQAGYGINFGNNGIGVNIEDESESSIILKKMIKNSIEYLSKN